MSVVMQWQACSFPLYFPHTHLHKHKDTHPLLAPLRLGLGIHSPIPKPPSPALAPPPPPSHLVVALQALGQREVDHEANIGLVDAHAEGDGGHNHLWRCGFGVCGRPGKGGREGGTEGVRRGGGQAGCRKGCQGRRVIYRNGSCSSTSAGVQKRRWQDSATRRIQAHPPRSVAFRLGWYLQPPCRLPAHPCCQPARTHLHLVVAPARLHRLPLLVTQAGVVVAAAGERGRAGGGLVEVVCACVG